MFVGFGSEYHLSEQPDNVVGNHYKIEGGLGGIKALLDKAVRTKIVFFTDYIKYTVQCLVLLFYCIGINPDVYG